MSANVPPQESDFSPRRTKGGWAIAALVVFLIAAVFGMVAYFA